MKVILSITWWRLFWASPDEGYSERHLIKVILSVTWWRLFWASPDKGYSEGHLMKVILSVTWWRLFQKRFVCTKWDIYVFTSIFWLFFLYFWLSCSKDFKITSFLVFQSFEFELTRWRLFQRRLMDTKFDINVLIQCIHGNDRVKVFFFFFFIIFV